MPSGNACLTPLTGEILCNKSLCFKQIVFRVILAQAVGEGNQQPLSALPSGQASADLWPQISHYQEYQEETASDIIAPQGHSWQDLTQNYQPVLSTGEMRCGLREG